MYLAVSIFLLVLITESILYLGYSYVTGLAYDLYSKLTNDNQVKEQKKLTRKLFEIKAELSATSSQDEFAKWAKIRRKMDKATADLETLTTDINYKKTAFEVKLKSFLWFSVHCSQFIMVLWYRKSPVFYLPPGWFGPAQRFLSWPFAPLGSVSVAVWFAACRKMVKSTGVLTRDFILSPPVVTIKTD